MTNRLILVDGSSVLSKNYYGTLPFEFKKAKTPEEKEKAMEKVMKTSDGQYTNAVYGMMKFLLKVIKEQKPTHLVIMWDKSRDTFRRKIYSDYKGQRGETPKPLSSQFGLAQRLLKDIGISTYVHDDFEADDIIGTFAKKFENEISTFIITGDQDSLQLITEKTRVWLSTSKAKDLYINRGMDIKNVDVPDGCFEYTPLTFEEEYGLQPIQIIDMKALEGDSSDNIPGVKGVGPKAVLPLLKEYGTIEGIYEVIESTPEKELKNFFKESLGISRSPIGNLTKEPTENEPIVGKKAAFLSKDLATIRTNIEHYDNISLDEIRLNINKDEMKQKFHELEFKSLVDKI